MRNDAEVVDGVVECRIRFTFTVGTECDPQSGTKVNGEFERELELVAQTHLADHTESKDGRNAISAEIAADGQTGAGIEGPGSGSPLGLGDDEIIHTGQTESEGRPTGKSEVQFEEVVTEVVLIGNLDAVTQTATDGTGLGHCGEGRREGQNRNKKSFFHCYKDLKVIISFFCTAKVVIFPFFTKTDYFCIRKMKSAMMREETVFGPIHSRRLGASLGINLLPRKGKLCNFDCIYCECGWNKDGKEDKTLPTAAEVRRALEDKLAELMLEGKHIDSITFSGDGEPTLNPEFPRIVEDTLTLRDGFFPEAKVSVLSNATRLGDPAIVEALKKVDNPILKIDAASDEAIAKINRPCFPYHLDVALLKGR